MKEQTGKRVGKREIFLFLSSLKRTFEKVR
ncbi:hypothetical protein TSAR_007524 [Trichomalopsis sarcophagae]|uniref:Uncharacterized protein n=1 Tax=Trichomalopsis sarcophagae TaxID=543379 RepID=A0A232EVZ5_9HYME|nr:hypothetical protein TSAR_007524 [Trichomalopsis sarcophagae]